MIKTFTSYHHANDQSYKDRLVNWATKEKLMEDISVRRGEIDETLEPQAIRIKIRDEHLKDSDVTILLCGRETRFRKHVDWELKSSMIDGRYNRRSGILVIDLPTSASTSWYAAFRGERAAVYPDCDDWPEVESYHSLEDMFPDMPRRILENLVKDDVKISVVPWKRVFQHNDRFRFLLQRTAAAGSKNQYDLARKMRMKNYNPRTDEIDHRI